MWGAKSQMLWRTVYSLFHAFEFEGTKGRLHGCERKQEGAVEIGLWDRQQNYVLS